MPWGTHGWASKLHEFSDVLCFGVAHAFVSELGKVYILKNSLSGSNLPKKVKNPL